MKDLDDVLRRAFAEVPQSLMGELLAKKLLEQGIRLSRRERQQFAQRVLNGEAGIRLRWWRSWGRRVVSIAFSPEEVRQLTNQLDDFVENRVPTVVPEIAATVADRILEDLRKRWKRHWRAERRMQDGFRRRLEQRWSRPLGLLRMLLAIAVEAGGALNQELRAKANDSPHTIEVLTRLHARACQICAEIITLLAAGFADGAMARWRTLHEVAVVSLFIQKHGEAAAQRYVEHEGVEAWRAAEEYRMRQSKLGFEPIPEDEMRQLKGQYHASIEKYGKSFGGSYGWAAHHLGNEKPTIASIEEAIGTGHLRPYYRMASHNVHANPKGVFFKLGLMNETELLLAGPSNAGLEEPGQNAGLSLLNVSLALVSVSASLDALVFLHIMMKLVDEIGPAFYDAAIALKKDDQTYRDGS